MGTVRGRITAAVLLATTLLLVLLIVRRPSTPETAIDVDSPSAVDAFRAPSPAPSTRSSDRAPTDSVSDDVVQAGEDEVPAQLGQFSAFLGGDLSDACGLDTGVFPPDVDPPFFGPDSEFYASHAPYAVGDPIVWCVYGFAVKAPIAVTISGPHGTVDRFVVTLSADGGARCWFGGCRKDAYLNLIVAEREPSKFKLAARRIYGPPAGAVAGSILPSSPAGRYVVAAAQGHLRTSVDLLVENARAPQLSLVSWTDERGSDGHSALLAGYEADSDIGLHVYEKRYVDGGAGARWQYSRTLATVTADGRGSAIYAFRTPTDLPPGEYCVVTVETMPEGDIVDEHGEIDDPCWPLAEHSGHFYID